MKLTIADAAQANFIDNPFVMYLVVFVVSMLIFIALRGFNCWYWKINERIALQQETNELLKQLIKQDTPVTYPKTILEEDYARLFMTEN
tara:strand:- start:141 stop:407 length:267 start_codon:yes stop_codon:yes gene_type:complete